jgi:isopenicillin-N epimerase
MDSALPFRRFWSLDPAITFLNHGSFGACPIPVLEAQTRLRAQLEREPVRFFVRELEPLFEEARSAVAALVGAAPEDLAFVANATAGVNTVLRSLDFAPGDELLTTNHAYNACKNALEYVARRAGARVVVAQVPFPLKGPDEVVDAVLQRVTSRTRLCLLDQVTSQTALVFPIDRLVAELDARGVDTLVDAAHCPGMRSLDLQKTGAAYTTGNFHKWVCAPKSAAFLHVRREKQAQICPLTVSHGANAVHPTRSRFLLESDWPGTVDPTVVLSVPVALRFLGELLPGGLPALMEHNRAAAITARRRLCEALEIQPPCPEEMLGSMAALPLPGDGQRLATAFSIDPLQEALFQRFGIEVPIFVWGSPPQRIIRISTPIYTTPGDIDTLAAALRELGIQGKGG